MTELATEMGISRATFFRYFIAKEDIVLFSLARLDVDFEPPSDASERHSVDDVWLLVRRMFEPVIELAEESPHSLRLRFEVVARTPAVQSRLASVRLRRVDELAAILTDVLDDEFTARIFAVSAVAVFGECLQTSRAIRIETGGTGSTNLVCFDALALVRASA